MSLPHIPLSAWTKNGTETDPLSLHLDQTTPQSFTGGTVTGSGLLNVTSGQLGLDTSTYITGLGWTELGGNQSDISLSGFNNDVPFISTLAFAGLSDYPADSAGVLTNDGAGALSWAPAGGAETDPIVGAITGVVQADGAGNISAWDYDYGDLINNPSIPDNLTDFITQTAWRVFYSDGSGDVQELALGTANKVLTSNGATSAPTWESAGSATMWNDIVDPDGDQEISLTGYKSKWISSLDGGDILWIQNVDEDLTTETTQLRLEYKDDGDAQGIFIECFDNESDLQFKVGANGEITTASGISHDDTSATDWTLAQLEQDKDILLTINDAATTRTAILVNGDEGSVTMARQSYVLAYRSTDLAVVDSTLTTIVFQTETTDVLGEYSTSTGIFTAKDAGKYVVMCCVQWEAINNGVNYQLRLYSGANPIAWDYITNNIVGAFTQFVGVTVNLAAGGTISIQCIQYSGGNETIDGSVNYITSLSIQKVA